MFSMSTRYLYGQMDIALSLGWEFAVLIRIKIWQRDYYSLATQSNFVLFTTLTSVELLNTWFIASAKYPVSSFKSFVSSKLTIL